ncbi:hypothetical protein GGS21DRAFT_547343 [Xylaria nigripes]|nr:hypothetical protein GGS21DRAFT_547343 [Xylaria nigripes]
MPSTLLSLLAVVGLARAHFHVKYPEWRDDSLDNKTYSQYQYPCAGVPYGIGHETEWPLTGGSVAFNLGHPWSYLFINLGLGDDTSSFNISLTPQLLNVTGKGNFCIPAVPVPVKVMDGQKATLQFVTNGDSGNSLYNCADIIFKSNAGPPPEGICKNDTGVTATILGQGTPTNSSPCTTSPPHSGAPAGIIESASRAVILMVIVSALAVAFQGEL